MVKNYTAKLQLDKINGKLLGVCAGLANWSGIDVKVLRILFVCAAIFAMGSPILIYLLLALILD